MSDDTPTDPKRRRGCLGYCHSCANCHENSFHACKIAQYMTARASMATVAPNQTIVFGPAITKNGSHIAHTEGTVEFTLTGGYIYHVAFSVNGIDLTMQQGMIFALKLGQFISDGRVVSQDVNPASSYNSGWTDYFVKVPKGSALSISIINLGLDTITTVNANISILQLERLS